MDVQALVATRRGLHGVAESVIAGPQYRAAGTIRMRVTPGGVGGVATPLRLDGAELVHPGGRVPLTGTVRQVAAAAGVDPGPPAGVYHDTADVGPDEPLVVDPAAATLLLRWFATGDAALRRFAPGVEPVLWPEHFDLAIQLDEVNYGVSPGDAGHERPYAYVGPWTPRQGAFWNASFGALRRADEIGVAGGEEALVAFFAEGRAAAGHRATAGRG